MANDLLAQSKTLGISEKVTIKPMASAKPVFLNSSMKNLSHKLNTHKSKSPYHIEALLATKGNNDVLKTQPRTSKKHHNKEGKGKNTAKN